MAWNLLLTSDIGLLSLFTILFMVAMAGFLYRYAVRHMAEEEKAATRPGRPSASAWTRR